jgi:hypothetical protein
MHHPAGNALYCVFPSIRMQGGVRSVRCNTLPGLHTQEEFLSIMLPSHGKHVQRPEHSSDLLHHAVTPKGMQTPRPSECSLCSSRSYQHKLLIMHLIADHASDCSGGCLQSASRPRSTGVALGLMAP